ncbi:hypothetical protein GUJ93_ZPchr0006g41159 [Zizania palustris]|uniref:Uncharacterized protein n=1 Tax=Zizania palustris TaxID=103762 RepID=A0A8J5SIN6_ZIZPA|nr:hypothetical protein GUJ93_ZPchr0006g41159 [Zizania palustris]
MVEGSDGDTVAGLGVPIPAAGSSAPGKWRSGRGVQRCGVGKSSAWQVHDDGGESNDVAELSAGAGYLRSSSWPTDRSMAS